MMLRKQKDIHTRILDGAGKLRLEMVHTDCCPAWIILNYVVQNVLKYMCKKIYSVPLICDKET
jgi:hypothetical protein